MPRISLGQKLTGSSLYVGLGWLVQAACVLSVLYVLVNAVWYFVVGPQATQSPSNVVTLTQPQTTEVNLEKILKTDLFGTPDIEETSVSAEKLKETTLNLELMGTVLVADARSQSSAFIRNKSGSQRSREYRQGDAIASYARVEEIHSRFVVISRGGEHERLTFAGDRVFSETDSMPQNPVATVAQTSTIQRSSQRQRLQESVNEYISSPGLEDLKQLGLAEIQTSAGLSLEIIDSDGTSPLAQLGMQPGDIVMKVNGHSLASLRSNESLAKEILASNQARLHINRGGREFQLTVPMPR